MFNKLRNGVTNAMEFGVGIFVVFLGLAALDSGYQFLKEYHSNLDVGYQEARDINGTYHPAKQRKDVEQGTTPQEVDVDYLDQNTYHNDSSVMQPDYLKITKHDMYGTLPNHQKFHFVISKRMIANYRRRTLVNADKTIRNVILEGHYVSSNWWVKQWQSQNYESDVNDINDDGGDAYIAHMNKYRPNNLLVIFYKGHLFINFSGDAMDCDKHDTSGYISKHWTRSDSLRSTHYKDLAQAVYDQQVFVKK